MIFRIVAWNCDMVAPSKKGLCKIHAKLLCRCIGIQIAFIM